MASPHYNDFSTWMKGKFPFRVQKISIDAGFTCPNRNGKIGVGGCIYCNNDTFNPSYCTPNKPIAQQLAEGKSFFGRKYADMKYLAYFQAYTNTFAPTEELEKLYREALSQEDMVGIVIGTRPDCVSDDLLDYLGDLARRHFVMIEYGVETTSDKTLQLINRNHTFECARNTIVRTHERGITTGIHVIFGLPGESAEFNVEQASVYSALPIDVMKIHQLQVIRNTRLAEMYAQEPFHLYTVDEYIELITNFLRRLRPDIVLDRFVSQSPANLLVAPRWGLKNYEFTNLLNNHLQRHEIYQGDLYERENIRKL